MTLPPGTHSFSLRAAGVIRWGVVATLLCTLAMPAWAGAPRKIGEDCVTEKCHASFGKKKYVHGPVDAGECEPCHVQKKEGRHDFEPVPEGDDPVCYDCHDRKDEGEVVHGPVMEGSCTDCHDPHASDYEYQLVADGSELCFNCHEDDKTNQKHVHGPVAVGACVACHDPHSSNNEVRLRKPGSAMCFECHEEMKERVETAPHVHPPVKEKCWNCHSPHGSPYEFQLLDPVPQLCFRCHKEKKKQVENAKTKHGAVTTGKLCLNCHDPHTAEYPKQLLKAPMDLCLSCHDKPMETPTKPIKNMKKWLADHKDHHGPIREKDCAACHNPHGSNNMRILRRAFPPTFYAPYDPKNYALCFGCHSPKLAEDAKTTTLTGFRKGDKNLHYVHVHRKKGRTCRACHQVHASNHPKHIRDSVPFGSWQLPINYEKFEDGGKCSPGCHVPREYHRTGGKKSDKKGSDEKK